MSLKRWKTSDRSLVLSGGDEADGPSCRAAIIVAEKEWLLYPLGLPGTAGRGPACPVVWEGSSGAHPLPPIPISSGCVIREWLNVNRFEVRLAFNE